MKNKGFRVLAATGAVAGLVVGVAPQSSRTAPPAPSLPRCTDAQLAPVLGATMVNQGVGSYGDQGYKLVRRKDTVVRFFLKNQSAVGSTCSGTTSVRSATLTVTSSSSPGGSYTASSLQTFGTSGTAIPSSTVSSDSNADPKFVVPADFANSCLENLATAACDDSASGFTLTFTADIKYSTSNTTTPVSMSPAPTANGTFDKSTNALRVLAVPMGDKSQSYSTQFSDSARVAVENGFAALSRIYPVPGGVSSTLNTTSGGIRYKLALAAMLDLKSVTGAYDSNGKFCGTQQNFDAGIKGLLAGFLSVYNSSITDTNQRADRVLGVVDKNISDGSTSSFNCAEAMASTSSPEAWVRAIPDQPAGQGKPAVPSMTGALMAMEFAHTYNLDTTLSFHSANTAADATAPERAYNVSQRSYLADDRSTMRFVSTNPFNNNNALFERDTFERMLCNLGGSLTSLPGTTSCATAAATGTVVAAGPTFAIFGTSDLATQAGTHVLESYESDNDPIFVNGTGSGLTLQYWDGDTKIGEVGIPYSNVSSEHVATANVNTTTAVFGGVFDVPTGQAYTKVRLVYNGITTLYERSSAPLESLSAGAGSTGPGGSVTGFEKTLTTPVIPPKPDVVFLADTTGSMGTALSNMKSNIVSIMNQVLDAQPEAQFGAASYKDFGCDSEVPFKVEQPLTSVDPDGQPVKNAVDSWDAQAGSGCDKPEAQLYALRCLATETCDDVAPDIGWRTGSSRIIVWFGDAPGHDPSNGISLDEAISALNDTGVRVIAINLVNDGEQSSLDGCFTDCGATGDSSLRLTGQATAIVEATEGVLKTTTDPNQVSASILEGLQNLPATVTPQATCDPNLTVTFDPTSQTVTSGEDVSFAETLNISSSATTGSTLTCTVQFLVNGVPESDPAFTQTLSIQVTGGRAFVGSFESTAPATLRAHVVYDCGNGEKEPAFVALEPDQVTSNVATFQERIDPSLSCANATGTASLTIVGTNGVDTASLTVPTSPSTLPVANKSPSAAIYQPSIEGAGGFTSPFTLNGHVADPEDGNLTAHWTIVSGPVKPSIPDGDVVDVRPPTAAGWPEGDYVIQLSGTDSKGATGTAQVTVHVKYSFLGFFLPAQNPPVLNMGKAGNSYPLKWSLKKQNGTFVSTLSVFVAFQFASIECPSGAPTEFLDTVSTGGSTLRYDTKAQQYVYNWATPTTPGCYMVTLYLDDGSTHVALFQLK